MADVIDIKKALPSARFKSLEWSDKRTTCKHDQVEIWPREPILECSNCGAVVDAYAWIRQVCERWRDMEAQVRFKVADMKREADDLKKALRILRAEYKDENERRQAERALMIMPPRKHY